MSINTRFPQVVGQRVIEIARAQQIGTLPYWALDRSDSDMAVSVNRETVPGYRIDITQADWHHMLEIVEAHHGACSRNPAVVDAWQQYRMLRALTDRS